MLAYTKLLLHYGPDEDRYTSVLARYTSTSGAGMVYGIP